MKTILLIPAIFLLPTLSQAQMVVQSGATITTTGAAIITLQNTGLRNNGTITQQPGGKFFFAGGNTDTISGTAPTTTFDSLHMAKTGTGKLVLQQSVTANAAVRFTSGNIDLAGSVLQLAPTAVLIGESPSSRITDNTQNGYVTITRSLNAPSAANPGNLGAIITSTQNLGNTVIRRGHKSQQNVAGTGSSINRYYDITPANNTAVNATLRLTYFDAELNGLSETDLNLYKSSNNTVWTNAGYTTRDGVANYVEKTGIPDFSRWTLSSLNNPLPLLFTSFQANCVQGNIALGWTTEQERNVSHFEVQRSDDAMAWKWIAAVPFTQAVHHYSYTDVNSKGFYRIAVVDRDGSRMYSDVAQAACKPGSDLVSVWPNPTTSQVYIALTNGHASAMAIKVYDAKGAVIVQQTAALTPGDNKVTLDMERLSAGIYWVMMDWNNGADHRSVKVVKQ